MALAPVSDATLRTHRSRRRIASEKTSSCHYSSVYMRIIRLTCRELRTAQARRALSDHERGLLPVPVVWLAFSDIRARQSALRDWTFEQRTLAAHRQDHVRIANVWSRHPPANCLRGRRRREAPRAHVLSEKIA